MKIKNILEDMLGDPPESMNDLTKLFKTVKILYKNLTTQKNRKENYNYTKKIKNVKFTKN